MSSFDTAVLGRLRQRLEETRVGAIATLASGRCADFSEYRFSCGFLEALRNVDVLIEEVMSDLQNG